MAFLEELGKTLTDTGKEVATKAKALTETIQLKSQLTAEKSKLKEAYAVVGRIYYEASREPGEEYAKAFEEVKAVRERIAGLEIELTKSEGSRICAVCGAKVSKDSLFCGKCGSAIKEEAAEDASAEPESGGEGGRAAKPDGSSGVPSAGEDAFVSSDDEGEQ